jgi:hypothetical protein
MMFRFPWVFTVALAALSSSSPLRAEPVTAGPATATREIVIGNPALVAGGAHVAKNLEAFLARLEQVGGWPKGSLRGTAFVRPREALDHVRKSKAAFAILPVHEFLQARKELKLEILGRAVGLEGAKAAYWGVTRNEKRPYDHIENHPGLRLATTEVGDPQWLDVLFENNVDPQKHFKLVEVANGGEAVAAVLAKKADVALIYETDFVPLKTRILGRTDLAWVYASGTIPPPPVLAVGKRTSAADRKRMASALGKLCKQEGADTCARMAILYAEPGRADTYQVVIEKYENY